MCKVIPRTGTGRGLPASFCSCVSSLSGPSCSSSRTASTATSCRTRGSRSIPLSRSSLRSWHFSRRSDSSSRDAGWICSSLAGSSRSDSGPRSSPSCPSSPLNELAAGRGLGGDRRGPARNGAPGSGAVRFPPGHEETACARRHARHRRRRTRRASGPTRACSVSSSTSGSAGDARSASVIVAYALLTAALTRCGRRLRVAVSPPRARSRQLAHACSHAGRLRRSALRPRARSIE